MITTNTIYRRGATAVLAVSLVGLLGACGVGSPDATVTPAPSDSSVQGTTREPNPSPGLTTPSTTTSAGAAVELLGLVRVTPGVAAQSALTAVANGRIYAIDLERGSGTLVWDVGVATRTTRYEVHVDATNGKVLAKRTDSSPADVTKAQRRLDATVVTYDEALRIASATVLQGQVVEIELDEPLGRLSWDVDVITSGPVRHELTIDAKTGKVWAHETESGHAGP